jgi:chromosome segregation ATPase
MHIIGLVAENFKRLRVVEITPKGRLVMVTGKNGQGKTSVLDSIWSGLVGSRAIPEKPVRKGADKARIKLDLGELIVTRQIAPDGTHTLRIETAQGTKITTPQTVLDELLGSLSFDPLEFISMKPKQQIEALRQVAKIDLDIDALNAAYKADYDERTTVHRDIKALETQISAITVQPDLPKAKIDESEIIAKIAEVDKINEQARAVDEEKRIAGEKLKATEAEFMSVAAQAAANLARIVELQKQLDEAQLAAVSFEEKITKLTQLIEVTRQQVEAMPSGQYANATQLTEELQQAQIVNREIGKRTKRDILQGQLNSRRDRGAQLSRQMEQRSAEKNTAIAKAAMPVEGLSFDENEVLFDGIPLEQLGDAEKIRISTAIAMAANPKLRVIRIMHGESLDEDALAVLTKMAEEKDFQIWMARVDTSGKVGIIMEDGAVKAHAEHAE